MKEEGVKGRFTCFLEPVKNFSGRFGNHGSSDAKVVGRKPLPVAQLRIIVIGFLSNKRKKKVREAVGFP